jgi:hypothetical protein
MSYIANRRHKRSYSINRFDDLDLQFTEDTTKEKIDEISTKATPIGNANNNIPNLSELSCMIQDIKQKITTECVDRSEKNMEIRRKVLKELYRNSSSNAVTFRKAEKKNDKCSKEIPKKCVPVQTSRPGLKPLKPKLRKQASLIQNMKENVSARKSVGKRSVSRNQRFKSNEIN